MIKQDQNQPATKKDLKQGLNKLGNDLRKKMATKQELGKLRKEMATKKDIKELRGDFRNEITRIDIRIDGIDKKIDKKITKGVDTILRSNDKIAKELKDFRQEQAAIHGNYKHIDKRVEKVEDFAEEADKKLNIWFQRAY